LYRTKYKPTMSKSTQFFGQSVFGQLISFIDNNIIYKNVKKSLLTDII